MQADGDIDVRQIIIIGSGPAGYTAALYAARANLRPLVIEGAASGGALMTTTEVENFPGWPDGILGPDLMDNLRKQAEKFGAEFLTDDATAVDFTGPVHTVTVAGTAYASHAVIAATGSRWRALNVPGEQRLLGRGVSSCATCDGFFFRGADIAVVGGGDSAMEEATFLTRFANSVTIVHRRDTFRASKIMVQRALANEKIRVRWDSAVEEVLGDDTVTGLRLRNLRTGEPSHLDVTGLFIAIGHDPSSEIFTDQLQLDDEGYLLVDAPSTRTNRPGVFACGDVVDHTYRRRSPRPGPDAWRRSTLSAGSPRTTCRSPAGMSGDVLGGESANAGRR